MGKTARKLVTLGAKGRVSEGKGLYPYWYTRSDLSPAGEPGISVHHHWYCHVGVDGTPLQIPGISLLKVHTGKNELEIHSLIADIHTTEGILRCDFLGPNQCIVDTGRKTLYLGSGEVIPLQQPLRNQEALSTPTQARAGGSMHFACGPASF